MDLEYCKKRGIRVANVSNYSTDAVVQHTFALTLYLLEKLPHYDTYVKSGAYGAGTVSVIMESLSGSLQEKPGVLSEWVISGKRLPPLPKPLVVM